MSRLELSLRALSLTGVALVATWFLYVALGWTIAPDTCQRAGFHVVSGALVVGAMGALALIAVQVRGRSGDGESESIGEFIGLLWLRLAALFVAGMTLAWILAVVWC